MAITVSKFKKIFGGGPPRAIFLFLNLLQTNFCRKKLRLKMYQYSFP